MRLLLLLSTIAILVGCHHKPVYYQHETRSVEEFDRDLARCEMGAYNVPSTPSAGYVQPTGGSFADGYNRGTAIARGSGDSKRRQAFIESCLRAEGWKQTR